MISSQWACRTWNAFRPKSAFIRGFRPIKTRRFLSTFQCTNLIHSLPRPLPANNITRLKVYQVPTLSAIYLTFRINGGGWTANCEKAQVNNILELQINGKSQFPGDFECENEKEILNEQSESDFEESPPKFPIGKFLSLLWPDFFWLLLAVAAAVGSAMTNVRIPKALGVLVNTINNMTKAGLFELPLVVQHARHLIGLYSAHSVLTAVYIAVLAYVGERLARRLRSELYNSLLVQDMAFFDAHSTGELVNRLTNDVQEFKSAFKSIISTGVKSVTQLLGSGGVLFGISPQLAGLTLVIIPFMVAFGSVFGFFLRQLSRAAQRLVSLSTATAEETLGNVRTVRAFGLEEAANQQYDTVLEEAEKMNAWLGLGIGIFQGLTNYAINGMSLAVLYYGGTLIGQGTLTGGDLMAYLVSVQLVQRALSSLSLLFSSAVRGAVAGGRVLEYMMVVPELSVEGGVVLDDVAGKITFQDVSFAYPTRPRSTVLNGLSLDIDAGTVLALCGTSGSGKSTIANLIERFYDPLGGTILVDNHDIKTLDPHWLRGNLIGYIGQEPALFSCSIMQNIRYGRLDATDEEIYRAAEQANAHGFITEFPEGYDTVVGERGTALSGGQRQRIAIARALLKNPRILILDEATSALDVESEHLVQEALQRAFSGRSVLIIAHRLSTIKKADCIAVLQRGQIAEKGSHSELMAKNGLYARLVLRQMLPDAKSGEEGERVGEGGESESDGNGLGIE